MYDIERYRVGSINIKQQQTKRINKIISVRKHFHIIIKGHGKASICSEGQGHIVCIPAKVKVMHVRTLLYRLGD